MNSPLWKLNLGDFERGLILTVLSAVLTVVLEVVSKGGFNINWKSVGAVAATAAIAYLLKNLSTNSENKVLKSEPKEEVK